MIIELESGVIITISAVNSITVFCGCVVNSDVFYELLETLKKYQVCLDFVTVYIPERFARYSPVEDFPLIQTGIYNAFKNRKRVLGGYVFKLKDNHEY